MQGGLRDSRGRHFLPKCPACSCNGKYDTARLVSKRCSFVRARLLRLSRCSYWPPFDQPRKAVENTAHRLSNAGSISFLMRLLRKVRSTGQEGASALASFEVSLAEFACKRASRASRALPKWLKDTVLASSYSFVYVRDRFRSLLFYPAAVLPLGF